MVKNSILTKKLEKKDKNKQKQNSNRSEVGCSEEFLLKKIPALCQRKLLDRKSLQSIHNENKGVLYHQFTLSLHWFAKLNSAVIIT